MTAQFSDVKTALENLKRINNSLTDIKNQKEDIWKKQSSLQKEISNLEDKKDGLHQEKRETKIAIKMLSLPKPILLKSKGLSVDRLTQMTEENLLLRGLDLDTINHIRAVLTRMNLSLKKDEKHLSKLEVLESDIRILGCATRTLKALRRINIFLIRDLIQIDEWEITRIPEVGELGTLQILDGLKALGLSLKPDPRKGR